MIWDPYVSSARGECFTNRPGSKLGAAKYCASRLDTQSMSATPNQICAPDFLHGKSEFREFRAKIIAQNWKYLEVSKAEIATIGLIVDPGG